MGVDHAVHEPPAAYDISTALVACEHASSTSQIGKQKQSTVVYNPFACFLIYIYTMATITDVVMTDGAVDAKKHAASELSDLLQTPHSDAFAFSDLEERVLDLYNQLRELELQSSLIKAHESGA